MKPLSELTSRHRKEYENKLAFFELDKDRFEAEKKGWKTRIEKRTAKGDTTESIAAPDKPTAPIEKRFTTKRKGHGIGLVTCQRIAIAHQGKMCYRKDNGSCFSLLIPVKQLEAHPESETFQNAPAEIN